MSTTTPNYISAEEPRRSVAQESTSHGFQRPHLQQGQLELGITEIAETQRNVAPSSGLQAMHHRKVWDSHRPMWLQAGLAEMFGVMFYCLCGQMAQTTLILTTVAKEPQGNLTMIGFAYAFGITFAIVTCGSASGGIFHPGVAIAQWLFKGFPAKSVPYYIFWQLLGGFLASLLVYVMWKPEIDLYEGALRAGGLEAAIFTNTGPAGLFALFQPAGRSLGTIFVNELVADIGIAIVIWANLDSSNVFVSPTSAPYTIGLAFATMIWGFSTGGLAANTARDLGGRMACGVLYGKGCFPASYSALASLTNILATLIGAGIYTYILSDTRRPPNHVTLAEHLEAEKKEHEANMKYHDDILDDRISKVQSKGGDASALMLRRTRTAHSPNKEKFSEELQP